MSVPGDLPRDEVPPLRVIKGSAPHVQLATKLTSVPTQIGIGEIEELNAELEHYMDVLLGREPCPIESPYLALQEVATAYHSRAQEIDYRIHQAEREGLVIRGSKLYRFRTGELRAFIELASKCAQLGSRRLTQESLLQAQKLEG